MDGLLSNIIYALLRKAFKQNFQLLDSFINKKNGESLQREWMFSQKENHILVLLFVVAVAVAVAWFCLL